MTRGIRVLAASNVVARRSVPVDFVTIGPFKRPKPKKYHTDVDMQANRSEAGIYTAKGSNLLKYEQSASKSAGESLKVLATCKVSCTPSDAPSSSVIHQKTMNESTICARDLPKHVHLKEHF